MATLICIAIVSLVSGISGIDVIYGYEDPSKNLVRNWDFEEALSPYWSVPDSATLSNEDAHTGQRSLRITSNTSLVTQLTHEFTGVKPLTEYYMSAFIKPIKDTSIGHFFMLRVKLSYRADGELVLRNVGRLPYVRSNGLWRQIGGDFGTGNDVITKLRFELETNRNDIEYLLDTFSLIELPSDPQWRKNAQADIEKYRKNNISLSMDIPPEVPYCDIKVKIEQTKRHFGVGATIKADQFKLADGFGPIYREFFFKVFEWAVFENDMKWKPMEGNGRGQIRYDRVDECLVFLKQKNVSLRGHSVFWSLMEANPDWFLALTTPEAILDAMEWRLTNVVPYYKGKLVQWDADNENLHGRYYTNRLNNPYSTDYIHQRIRDLDPNVEIYLNDYEVLRSSEYTSAIRDLAVDLQSRNVPVNGIGAQSHMRQLPFSPAQIKQRLKILASAGVPIMITELGIHSLNTNVRASHYDVFLHMVFSNPNVDGIVLWQFSDRSEIKFEPEETALFNGPDFTPNAAGEVFLNITRSWRTNVDFDARSRAMREYFRAFHGAYKASVYYKDKLIKSQSFYLHPGQDIEVNISFSAANFAVVDDGHHTQCDQTTIDVVTPTVSNVVNPTVSDVVNPTVSNVVSSTVIDVVTSTEIDVVSQTDIDVVNPTVINVTRPNIYIVRTNNRGAGYNRRGDNFLRILLSSVLLFILYPLY